MKFAPKTEKEVNESGLMPKGIYPFSVISAEDARSKAGNDMIKATIRVFQPDGKTRQLITYLMEAMPAQLFHFCTYCGLAVQYENGTLKAADCVGKEGYCEIIIKEDKSGQYGPQNNIKDFVRPEALKPGAMAPTKPSGEQMEGDPY